jgi:hypothetical protein
MSRSSSRRIRRPFAVSGQFARDERGQALVELALAMPVLFLVLLGTIEFGRMLEFQHAITGLGREAAGICSRGGTLEEAVDVALANGADIRLGDRGAVVASRIVFEEGGPVIEEQLATLGSSGSRLGAPGQVAAELAALGLQVGEVLHIVEITYRYEPLTPLQSITDLVLPEELYDRSVF